MANHLFQNVHKLEHNIDKLVLSNRKSESIFSPFVYSPKYLEDIMARERLKGNQSPYIRLRM